VRGMWDWSISFPRPNRSQTHTSFWWSSQRSCRVLPGTLSPSFHTHCYFLTHPLFGQ
jgi:hypothetical protein